MMHIPELYILNTNLKGRAVYTGEDLAKGDIIEVCPVIIVPQKEVKELDRTILHNYYFLWDIHGDACLALGYGSLYNHNDAPNAAAINLINEDQIKIISTQDIEAGTEITISYVDKKFGHKLWFKVVD